MKDGRVGAFAVIGLIFLLGIKFLALDHLPDHIKGKILLFFPVVGRWAMVLGAAVSKAARREGGLGKPYLEHMGLTAFSLASASCIVIGSALFHWRGMMFIAAVGIVVLMMVAYVHRRIRGITGDVLGAINEVGEAFTLVLMAGIF
jgi:adenosylcobinamide-GDP ribazoletransferase